MCRLCVGFGLPQTCCSLSFFWYVVHNQIQTLLVILISLKRSSCFDLFKLVILHFTCPLQFEQPLFALPPLAVCIIRCSLYSCSVSQALWQVTSWFKGCWGEVFLTTRGCRGSSAVHGKRYWSTGMLMMSDQVLYEVYLKVWFADRLKIVRIEHLPNC